MRPIQLINFYLISTQGIEVENTMTVRGEEVAKSYKMFFFVTDIHLNKLECLSVARACPG